MAQTTATSVTATGVLTVNSVSGISTGQAVQMTGVMFGGLQLNTTYFVIAVGSNTISLSATSGGSPLTISPGSGSCFVTTGVTATSLTTGGVLTVGSTTGVTVGRSVRVFGTTFGGLISTRSYFVIAVTSSTVTLSLTAGGTAASFVGGTGSMIAQFGPTVGPGTGSVITKGSTTVSDPGYGDYNTIQALVSKVLGPPSDSDPRYGYNQTVSSSSVAFGDKINLSQWVNLRSDMIKARGHQTGSANEANNITLPTSSSKVTEALRYEYLTYAQTLTTYRDTLGTAQYSPITGNTCVRNTAWNTSLTSTITVNCGDQVNARAFFNAGGEIKFSASLDGSFSAASSAKDGAWKEMFQKMGTIYFGRTATTIAQGSTGTTYNVGYFNLTTSDQLIFRKDAPTGNYTPNKFEIKARLNSTNNGIMIFTLVYTDADQGLLNADGSARSNNGWRQDEYVDGVLTQITALTVPSGGYVTFIPVGKQPTVTQSGDFQNTTSLVYGLIASAYTVNEGDTLTVQLDTLNVADGIYVPYTVTGTGISSSRFTSGSMSGNFRVYNNTAQQTWVIANNLYTDGATTMTVQLNNGLSLVNIAINDTSKTPTGSAKYDSVGPNQTWTAPPGVRTITALIIGGGGGGGNFAGGGGGAGQIRYFNTNTSPGQLYYLTVGDGGNARAVGGTSDFSGNPAYGGSPGTSGTSTGHGGTHTGGTGGTNGNGSYAGGTGSTTSGTASKIGGGGGGGYAQGGSNGDGTNNAGGKGGNGQMITFYDQNPIYVGGGGGGGAGQTGGAATFGGGNGDSGNGTGDPGVANSGGGGGGGGANYEGTQTGGTLVGYSGGKGGSGRVWIGWP